MSNEGIETMTQDFKVGDVVITVDDNAPRLVSGIITDSKRLFIWGPENSEIEIAFADVKEHYVPYSRLDQPKAPE